MTQSHPRICWVNRISLLKWSRLCWSVEISFPSSVGALTSGRFLCAIALLPAKSPCWQPPWPYKPATSQVVGETNIYIYIYVSLMRISMPSMPLKSTAYEIHWNTMKLSWIALNPVAWNRALTRLLVIRQQSQCSWEVTRNCRWGVTWCNSYCNNCLGGWPRSKLQPSPVGNLWPWKLISVWDRACVLRSHVVTGWAGVGCLIKWASYTTPVNWPVTNHWLLDYTDNQVPALVVGLGLLFLTSWAVQFGSPWVLVSRQSKSCGEIGPQSRWDCSQHQATYHKPRSTADFTDFDYEWQWYIHPHGCVRVRARVRLLQRCHRVHQHSAINECKSKNMPTHQKQKIISSLAMLK